MSTNQSDNMLEVQASESGQKLLQFLTRRLNLPQSLLHRWIRTGQIRVNAGRAKPFLHIQTNDLIRIPPFALGMMDSAKVNASQNGDELNFLQTDMDIQLPELIYENEHLLVFNKPYGLPVHTGTGHTDSLATRLGENYKHEPFRPTPAHRLDKNTTGIILVARSYTCLRALQNAFEQRVVSKEYLAWINGEWQHKGPKLLSHKIGKSYVGYDEKVRILPQDSGREATCISSCLRHSNGNSLMHIRLITGRTHQIRVQLAEEGHAVLGDAKYSAQTAENIIDASHRMRLHALRIVLPHTEDFVALGLMDKSFEILPNWEGWQNVDTMPTALPLALTS